MRFNSEMISNTMRYTGDSKFSYAKPYQSEIYMSEWDDRDDDIIGVLV